MMKQNFLPRRDDTQHTPLYRFVVVFLCALIFSSGLYAQCPPGNVSLNTQAQVNAFLTNYPNCTQINGNLSIVSSPATSITNLTPLHNIATVTGTLNVTNTAGLQNLSGLSGLTTIGGNFYIDSNPGLQSVNGMNALQTVGGFLYVINNSAIQTFNGFHNLHSLGTGFWFNNNDALTQFQAFDDLTTISGPIVIVENTNLNSVFDLSGVVTNQGFIHIQNNPALTSIYGLHNLNSATITFLYLLGCPQLSICGVQSICNYLNSGTSNYLINTNATGCMNKPDIIAHCVYQPVFGCTDPDAHNYNEDAIYDDGSCETCSDGIQNGDETGVDCGGDLCDPCPEILGCTDPDAHNYNPDATVDNGSCQTCSDGLLNGDEVAVDCGGSHCIPCIYGCRDSSAHNYNPAADIDDGSCQTCSDSIQNGGETGIDCGGTLCGPCPIYGCTIPGSHNYNPLATIDDGSCQTCTDDILNGDETSIDCGGSCGYLCPPAPFVPCSDVILYVDPDSPDYQGTIDDKDIFLKSTIYFMEGLTYNGPYVLSNIKRKSHYLKHDWTTNGACIDGIPDGYKKDVDKGKEYRDCLPIAGDDIQDGERDYKLLVWDIYGSCECSGHYWVDTLTSANLAKPEIQIAPTEEHALPAPTAMTKLAEPESPSNFMVIPNPGKDIIRVNWHTAGIEHIRLIISDMSGRVLSNHDLTSLAGNNQLQLDMARFTSGLYIFTLQKHDSLETFKWIKTE